MKESKSKKKNGLASGWNAVVSDIGVGSKRFVASVRNRFLPEHLAAAVPQQLRLARDKELHVILKAAAQQIGCDLPRLIEARRVSGIEKEKRDALIYWVWKAGRFTNGQIGKLFGLTYSAVSHSVLEMKRKLSSDKELRTLTEMTSMPELRLN